MGNKALLVLVMAATYAATLFVGAFLAQWISWAGLGGKTYLRSRAYTQMMLLGHAAERFRKAKGRCPKGDEALSATEFRSLDRRDPWDGALEIVPRDGACTVVCYGSDRVPGGVGLAVDFSLGDNVEALPKQTFSQYVADKPLSSGLLMFVAPAGVVTGLVARRWRR